ncbi:DNA-binding transcriptional repressor AcrR [Dictyobacter vulcani]|uniref:DNA-binding transcriptional repressor AcrR n=1 Tax=Dictyobacter vulcani TaxID=2607529 RepID=A0A5J4KVE7_9CHLR|nr:TetR family transcriptional regulator [Dictyobacter vulcani]GER90487.1 DNA-binding transcriptional repressor AcrR [Dictyobacter vulcani]
MRKTKEDAAITRKRLLDAALESFHTHGYAATTLEDIARRAGITRGAIQWHFGSKADLFNTLVRECYQRVAIQFQAIYTQGGTPLQALRRILLSWLTYPEQDADFRIMLELTLLKTEVSPELAEGMQEKIAGNRSSIQFFAGLIQQGITAGEIRSDVRPEVAATAALGIINGMTSLWLVDPTAFSLQSYAEDTVDLFLQGIAQG